MAVNQLKKAKEQQKARARARQRREMREQQPEARHPQAELRDQQLAEQVLSPRLSALGFAEHNVEVIPTPSDREKISEVLFEFVAPFRVDSSSEEELRVLINLGVIAWNALLMPPKLRESTVRKCMAELPETVQIMFEQMVVRRIELFAHDRRIIVDFKMTRTSNGLHLSVASTLDSSD
jgi:hypothetical protein